MPEVGEARRSLRPALVAGGAVVFDEAGQVALGLSDASLRRLVGDAPDFMRIAVAHLAAERAIDTGLITAPAPFAGDEEAGTGEAAWAGAPPGTRCVDGPRRERGIGDDPLGDDPVGVAGVGPVRVDGPLRVVRASAFLGAELLEACLRARDEGEALLPVVASGTRAYVGPLLQPDGRPCILCLRRAVGPNRKCERVLAPEPPSAAPPRPSDARVASLFRRQASSAASEILELDADARILGRHHVRPDPACPVCGSGTADRNAARPDLESDAWSVHVDTGVRSRHPRDTLAAYRHLISPLTGAVRRLRRVDVGAPDLIHVFTASHAMSEASRSFSAVMRDGRDHSGGKGSTADQARASALCEALERFSAIATGDEVDVVGRLDEVEGAVDPRRCLLFSDAQYRQRDEWNVGASRFQHVPEPFDPREEIAWSRVWCAATGEPAYLPTALLYFDFDGPGGSRCHADSNGLAAGATLGEAVLQGFLEVVERDAVAIWWYNRLRVGEVDTASFGDRYVDDVIAHYASLGRRAWVMDLTSDLGIPVFAAVSARAEAPLPEVIFGFGSHLDPGIALRRCITEMSQMLATVRRPPEQRRAQLAGTFDDALSWWGEATLEKHPYLLPDVEQERRGIECFENTVGGYEGTDARGADILTADLDACLAIAGRTGLPVYVRDVTRADLGIPVAKVVVPELRHFWRRLAPGRLFQVPVGLGRRAAPAAESDMNPVSLFV